jgi:hypothetical protein
MVSTTVAPCCAQRIQFQPKGIVVVVIVVVVVEVLLLLRLLLLLVVVVLLLFFPHLCKPAICIGSVLAHPRTAWPSWVHSLASLQSALGRSLRTRWWPCAQLGQVGYIPLRASISALGRSLRTRWWPCAQLAQVGYIPWTSAGLGTRSRKTIPFASPSGLPAAGIGSVCLTNTSGDGVLAPRPYGQP